MRDTIEAAFGEAESLLSRFRTDSAQQDALTGCADVIHQVLGAGSKILVCGNGGSMADAMHFAEEWTGRFRTDRAPYPVMALSDPTHLTCVANDYGFEAVFERSVRAFGEPGDLLIVLSTSGNSPNLVRAAIAAKERSMSVVGFLGRGGGALLAHCDISVVAPGETADRIQEIHMLCLHAIIEAVEGALEANS